MTRRTNHDLYGSSLLDEWSGGEGLSRAEAYLVDRYLETAGRTMEAGTGGGRIVRAMQASGFDDLTGFDYVPAMIDAARAQDASGRIDFDVQDATALDYPADEFDQVIYLQQIVCFIEDADGRARALAESFRVLRPGGVAIFSFLSWDQRARHRSRGWLTHWVRVLRRLGRRSTDIRSQPWLRLGGRPNPRALLDAGPYVRWFDRGEAVSLVTEAGYEIDAVGPYDELEGESVANQAAGGDSADALYVVATKPRTD